VAVSTIVRSTVTQVGDPIFPVIDSFFGIESCSVGFANEGAAGRVAVKAQWRSDMDLDQLQRAYKERVEEWIAAIKHEEALASVHHSVAKVDEWEQAHFKEDEIRNQVLAAKKKYEDALRESLFGIKAG
jgi:hypothetical protein